MKTVSLLGEIKPKSIEEVKKEILEALKESQDEVILFVCSPGGSGPYAIHFYEWVLMEKIPLITVASGEVASAALIVFLAGRKRKATSHRWFCVHKGGSFKWDCLAKLLRIFAPKRYKEGIELMATYKQKAEEIILSETEVPPTKLHQALRKSYWIFDAYEAKEWGLVEEIIEV